MSIQKFNFSDYKIADLNLATAGRTAIEHAESEMPGLMALRKQYQHKKPLAGARIAGCLHLTVQTAVFIETLIALGASVRWSSCNILSTQDHAAAALVSKQIPIFGWKRQTVGEYWDCIEKTLSGPNDWTPDLLVDDGGDLVDLIHEKKSELHAPILGVSEETTTGIQRLEQRLKNKQLKFAVLNVNQSVTKSKFDNLYGCRESLIDGIKRATNIMIAGKIAVVLGYGDVGKGCAQALRHMGATVWITEIDPICALQARMEGYPVVDLSGSNILNQIDLFVTATGNRHVITHEQCLNMKNHAILCNIGHFDHEIDIHSLRQYAWNTIKPEVHEILLPNHKKIILLAEGRLVNLGCAEGHSSFVMSLSFTNQIFAQIELWTNRQAYLEPKIYCLPKTLDEQVARLHLEAVHGQLTRLTSEQAHYLGRGIEGPYKSDDYRY